MISSRECTMYTWKEFVFRCFRMECSELFFLGWDFMSWESYQPGRRWYRREGTLTFQRSFGYKWHVCIFPCNRCRWGPVCFGGGRVRSGHKYCKCQVTGIGDGEDIKQGWLNPTLTILWMDPDYGEAIKAIWLGKCRICIYVEAVSKFI